MNTIFISHLLLATQLFGLVVTLCVLVSGFFLGRRWLSKVDFAPEPNSKDVYRALRSGGTTPSDMQKMSGGWRKLY